MSDVVIINKIDSAHPEDIAKVRKTITELAPQAVVVDAASPIRVEKPELIKNKSVLVIEDGPTMTHGGMKLGAGMIAAQKFNAAKLVDPRPYLVGQLKDTFNKYPDIGMLLPAMGYGDDQRKDLEETISACPCDTVIIGTPIDLNRVVNIRKPSTRVFYDIQSIGNPDLESVMDKFLEDHKIGYEFAEML